MHQAEGLESSIVRPRSISGNTFNFLFYSRPFFFIKKQFTSRAPLSKTSPVKLLLWPRDAGNGNWNISLNDAIKQIILWTFYPFFTPCNLSSNSFTRSIKIFSYRFKFKSRTSSEIFLFTFPSLLSFALQARRTSDSNSYSNCGKIATDITNH